MLTNTVTPDVAGVVAGEAAPVRGDVTGAVTVLVTNSNANSNVYTCPTDSYVEGFVHISNDASSGYAEVKVNGKLVKMLNGNTGTPSNEHALYLGPGDVLATGSGSYSYWTFNGLIKKF